MADAPRLAVIGARRGRQGLGEHLARFAARHGAAIPAFIGTSDATVREAGRVLASHGIEARGYTDLDALLGAEQIDGLVIASPAATHGRYLESALAEGLHVLCEKPLTGSEAGSGAEACRLERAFAEAGLVLFENVQWPYTLAAYRALHPAAPREPEHRFEMWMGPTGRGAAMLGEALSHPLSLLEALFPGAEEGPQAPRFSTLEPDARTLDVSFRFRDGARAIDVVVKLTSTPRQPRPAGYALDGLRAERRVRMQDYALSFEDGGRRVPVPDPMESLVRDFVAALAGGTTPAEGPHRRGLGRRVAWLERLVAAFGGSGPRAPGLEGA